MYRNATFRSRLLVEFDWILLESFGLVESISLISISSFGSFIDFTASDKTLVVYSELIPKHKRKEIANIASKNSKNRMIQYKTNKKLQYCGAVYCSRWSNIL